MAATAIPESVRVDAVLDRIKAMEKMSGYGSDSALARFLGVTPQVINGWCKRNQIDFGVVMRRCHPPRYSMDWLLYGKNETPERHVALQEHYLKEAEGSGPSIYLATFRELLQRMARSEEEIENLKRERLASPAPRSTASAVHPLPTPARR